MNRKTVVIALLATLLAGTALGYWLAGPPATGGAPAAQDERRVLYWYDPMKPDVRFDKPGPSPFMDMALVPKYADEAGTTGVRIDPAIVQNLGIRTARVERAALAPRLAAVGSVAFDERLLETVAARVEGALVRLHAKAPLERVRRGQPLADIVAPQWRAAEEEYLVLLDATSDRARAIRDAARERLTVLGVPAATVRKIEETRTVSGTTTLFAPADGVVTGLAAREGDAFPAGAQLFRINGLDTVWVNAAVPEAQVAALSPESAVAIQATAWPGATFEGRILALLPEVDRETRTITVRIAVDNPGHRLAPGMFVSLAFAGEAREPQLVVPSEAVIVTGERSVVVVARGDGDFDVAEVTTGAESGGMTEILSGLVEGQSVVRSGQFLIDSEASLRSAITRLETGGAAPEKAP